MFVFLGLFHKDSKHRPPIPYRMSCCLLHSDQGCDVTGQDLSFIVLTIAGLKCYTCVKTYEKYLIIFGL